MFEDKPKSKLKRLPFFNSKVPTRETIGGHGRMQSKGRKSSLRQESRKKKLESEEEMTGERRA